MEIDRALAAILHADVAGYSRQMGVDEEGTYARIKALRRELIDPKIAEHHGRIVSTSGDGILVEFRSAVHAVLCAVEIQQEIANGNADYPPAQRIEYRIGVNVGDVIADGADVVGDDVNLAARLQQAAPPGGVLISESVFEQVNGKVICRFDDIGERRFKNMARSVHVRRIIIGREDGGQLDAPAPEHAFDESVSDRNLERTVKAFRGASRSQRRISAQPRRYRAILNRVASPVGGALLAIIALLLTLVAFLFGDVHEFTNNVMKHLYIYTLAAAPAIPTAALVV
jgi:class 3 adenylate cyclase